MQIRLLGASGSDPSVLPPRDAQENISVDIMRWRLYVDSYASQFPTETLRGVVRQRIRKPYLSRYASLMPAFVALFLTVYP